MLRNARRTIAMVPPHSTRMEVSTPEQVAVVAPSVREQVASMDSVVARVVLVGLEVGLEELTSTSTTSLERLRASLVVAADEAPRRRFLWVRISRSRRTSPSWTPQRAPVKASLLRQWSTVVAAVEMARRLARSGHSAAPVVEREPSPSPRDRSICRVLAVPVVALENPSHEAPSAVLAKETAL